MQTILGAGGAIGRELAKVLPKYTQHLRLVSRHPQKINATDEILSADLSNAAQVQKAVKGSEVVYLTLGLPYRSKVWQAEWEPVMRNVIEACLQENAKLVFFDNIYMYDTTLQVPITEQHPIAPKTRKGQVRAKIAEMLLEATQKQSLKALIARSADFYGPSVGTNSILSEMVFQALNQGKKATWLADDQYKHSFTFTPDAARATALLGNSEEAYGEVWHLPTAPNPPTGKEWIEMIAECFQAIPRYRVVSKSMIAVAGLLVPLMHEIAEMLYQLEQDYVFSSEKFEKHFGLQATAYGDGIRQILEQDYPQAYWKMHAA